MASTSRRRLTPGAGRFAARIARPAAAGALACGTVLAMTAPALGQPPSWSVVPSPNGTGSLLNALDGVSCLSLAACTAAGSYQNSRHVLRTLIESWDGTGWSVLPSPNAGPSFEPDMLSGVSCLSATACTAAGYRFRSGGGVKTLVESWNGTGWSVASTPSPPPADGSSFLNGVSCVSASACTAAGAQHSSGSPGMTLIESSS